MVRLADTKIQAGEDAHLHHLHPKNVTKTEIESSLRMLRDNGAFKPTSKLYSELPKKLISTRDLLGEIIHTRRSYMHDDKLMQCTLQNDEGKPNLTTFATEDLAEMINKMVYAGNKIAPSKHLKEQLSEIAGHVR